jgi:hypothetical protein
MLAACERRERRSVDRPRSLERIAPRTAAALDLAEDPEPRIGEVSLRLLGLIGR